MEVLLASAEDLSNQSVIIYVLYLIFDYGWLWMLQPLISIVM